MSAATPRALIPSPKICCNQNQNVLEQVQKQINNVLSIALRTQPRRVRRVATWLKWPGVKSSSPSAPIQTFGAARAGQ